MKSPMELIAEIPPIKVDARVVACEGGMHNGQQHFYIDEIEVAWTQVSSNYCQYSPPTIIIVCGVHDLVV